MLNNDEILSIKKELCKLKTHQKIKDNTNSDEFNDIIDFLADNITMSCSKHKLTSYTSTMEAINDVIISNSDKYIDEYLSYIDMHNLKKIPYDEYINMQQVWVMKLSARVYVLSITKTLEKERGNNGRN